MNEEGLKEIEIRHEHPTAFNDENTVHEQTYESQQQILSPTVDENVHDVSVTPSPSTSNSYATTTTTNHNRERRDLFVLGTVGE